MLKSELEVLYKKALEDLKLNIDLVKKMREDAATYKRRIQELESHVADQGAALSGQGKTIHGLREELRTFICSRCEQREPEELAVEKLMGKITVPGQEYFTGVVTAAEWVDEPYSVSLSILNSDGRRVEGCHRLINPFEGPEFFIGSQIEQLVYTDTIIYPEEKMKVYTLDEVKDDILGVKGTEKRDNYETELAAELAEEEQLDPRYVTWDKLARAYEHSASKKWNILEMATYLRSLAPSPEEFDGCPHNVCTCAGLYNAPGKGCLPRMPEKQELKWRKKIMD